jgi:type II secretory pathway pseudopilin PulG
LVELLTTVGIISILLALLVPALTMVRKMAKEAEQKAQFSAIGLALEAYKHDYASYPESSWMNDLPTQNPDYQGTQRLTEALVGMDLLGFHPDTGWRSDGRDDNMTTEIYPSFPSTPTEQNLRERTGPYLESASDKIFMLRDLYPGPTGNGDVGAGLAPNTRVICDVFKAAKVIMPTTGEVIRAGTPILYYKADTSKKTMVSASYPGRIYNVLDNIGILMQGRLAYGEKSYNERQQVAYRHELGGLPDIFYNLGPYPYKVIDPKITTYKWPYRADSYLLISAGWDGNFGTQDDIVNY